MRYATPKKKGKVPLDRALSKLGLASRTQAKALIEQGKVRVNGTLRTDCRFLVTPETARIQIGEELQTAPTRRVFLLHKPKGVVTTHADEKGRATVFDLVKSIGLFLHAVGRLDFATSGLLLLTNDSKLSAYLTNPENRIERVYHVTVRGNFTEEKAHKMEKGFVHDGEKLAAEKVHIRKASQRETHVLVTLTEGKNREIRRLFESLGHPVTKLKRTAFGGLDLGALNPGEFRELMPKEIHQAFPEIDTRIQLK